MAPPRGLHDHPVFVIASRALALDPASPVFADAPVRPVIVTIESAPARARAALAEVADVVDCGRDELDPAVMRARLAERGRADVLCEGGPTLLGSLLAADAVDELCLTSRASSSSGRGRASRTALAVRRMRRSASCERSRPHPEVPAVLTGARSRRPPSRRSCLRWSL